MKLGGGKTTEQNKAFRHGGSACVQVQPTPWKQWHRLLPRNCLLHARRTHHSWRNDNESRGCSQQECKQSRQKYDEHVFFFFFTLIKKILAKHKEPNSSSIRFANQNGMSSDHKRANRCYFLPELVLQKLNKKERRMRLVRTASS